MQLNSTNKQFLPPKRLLAMNEHQKLISVFQSSPIISENQEIQKKMQLKLYFHFEQILNENARRSKNLYQRIKMKTVSKQRIVYEGINFLNQIQLKINPLPPDYQQQLLFLIDYFDKNKQLISNYYRSNRQSKQSDQAKFYLNLQKLTYKIDFEKFVGFSWNHLVQISFYQCHFINKNWRAFVQHASNFINLKDVNFHSNDITEIREGDIEQFKSIKCLYFSDNPLTSQSIQVIKKVKNDKIKIIFTQYHLEEYKERMRAKERQQRERERKWESELQLKRDRQKEWERRREQERLRQWEQEWQWEQQLQRQREWEIEWQWQQEWEWQRRLQQEQKPKVNQKQETQLELEMKSQREVQPESDSWKCPFVWRYFS